jgi:arylsulfatase B
VEFFACLHAENPAPPPPPAAAGRIPAARLLLPMAVAALRLLTAAAALVAVTLATDAVGVVGRSAPQKPHIVFLFCDNVGWSNVGYHRSVPTPEVKTPRIDELARTGLELDRMYTYKFCSPSRSSLLSGRLPIHVNIYNDNPARPGAGVPVGMTLISEKLASAGYIGHFIGKWHIGMATTAQTPRGRGFRTSLGYFHSFNDYFTQQRAEGCDGVPYVDLWDTDHPAVHLNASGPEGGYEEAIFTTRALSIIQEHPADAPLYLYYALHTSCVGGWFKPEVLQAPARFYDQLGFIDNEDRRKNHAMIWFMDEAVGNITDSLRARGMWNSTLLVSAPFFRHFYGLF